MIPGIHWNLVFFFQEKIRSTIFIVLEEIWKPSKLHTFHFQLNVKYYFTSYVHLKVQKTMVQCRISHWVFAILYPLTTNQSSITTVF